MDCPYDVEWCDRDRRWCGECSADADDWRRATSRDPWGKIVDAKTGQIHENKYIKDEDTDNE